MNEIEELRERSKQLRQSRKELRKSIIQIADLFGDKKKCSRCDDEQFTNMHYKYNFYDDFRREIYTNDEAAIQGKTYNPTGIRLGGGDYTICEDIHTFVPRIDIKEVSAYEQINVQERLEFKDGHLLISEYYGGEYYELNWHRVDNSTLKSIIEDDLIPKIIDKLLKSTDAELKDYTRVKTIAQKLADAVNPNHDQEVITT